MPALSAVRDSLFDPDFLESIRHLRIIARRVPHGGRFAEQRAADLGHGIEFRDFRAYTPGDDLRAVDWNIYRRLGRVFIRLFEEFKDLPLYLMPDVSRSMFLDTPPRADAGLRAALALASIALGQHDSVGVFAFSGDLRVVQRSMSGRDRLMTVARHIASLVPDDADSADRATSFAKSIRRLNAINVRRGLLVVVSDFFDPGGLDTIVESLKTVRHQLLLVQLTRKSDRDPDVRGDLRLRDCETGAVEDVSITPAVLLSYREAYDRFSSALFEFARRRNAGLLRLDVEEPIVPQLAQLFESGSFTA